MAVTHPPQASQRVAFFLSSFPAGGLERVTLSLMHGLRAQGYDIDLVLERRTGDYLAQLPEGVRCLELTSGSKWRACAALFRVWPREGAALGWRMLGPRQPYIPLGRLQALVDYIEHERPDVLIAAAGRIPFLALWARRMARPSCPVVIAEHSTFSARESAVRAHRAAHARMRYRRGLIRRLYPSADAVIAVSDGVAADTAALAGLAPSAITRIYNPVVGRALHDGIDETPAHGWFASEARVPVLLAAGRLAPEKAFHVLIEAFAVLVSKSRPYRLMIVGEGPERGRLERRIHELGLAASVSLPGWVDNPYALMARSHLFVSCSRFEGLPVGLIEALACGCAVVATDCPSGPREILAAGRYGRLVGVDDVPGLAAAMKAELATPSAPERQRRQRGAEFGVAPAVAAYEQLIRQVSIARVSSPEAIAR